MEDLIATQTTSHGSIECLKAKHFDREYWFFYWKNDEGREILRIRCEFIPDMTKEVAKAIIDAFFTGRSEGIGEGEYRAKERMRQALGIK